MYSIKAGDLSPALVATLSDANGPIDLTTAASVTLNAQQIDGLQVISGLCTVLNAPFGQIQYAWMPGDTSVVGLYQMDFTILWPGNLPRTVPNDGYVTLAVLARA